MPTKLPLPKQPLAEAEWDFSRERVPDSDMLVCLVWELLRESSTARLVAQDWRKVWANPAANDDIASLIIRTNALAPRINHPFNWEAFGIQAIVEGFGICECADTPWQALIEPKRRELRERFSLVNPPVFLAYKLFCVWMAQEIQKRAQMEPQKLPNGGIRSPKLERAELPAPNEGKEAFCIIVDWRRYDDNTIKQCFAEIADDIIESRPKNYEPLVRKESGLQRLAEWRGKLQSLGRTRIYCWYNGVSHLKTSYPKAYAAVAQELGDKGVTAIGKALDASKRRFLRAFHDILPYEKSHMPLCIQRSRFGR